MLKQTKRALLLSIFALIACVCMFTGTTYAWFTDSVSSSGNIIQTGTLDVAMSWKVANEDLNNENWKDASKGAIFNNKHWEPGYTEARHIKISNEGTLALKYNVLFKATSEVGKLADVIDVYYADPAEKVLSSKDLKETNKLGTLTEVLAMFGQTGSGVLLPGESVVITLALKMQEEAGNEYQNLTIGSEFTIQVLATQASYEEDSFGPNYDAGSPWLGGIDTSWYDETKTEYVIYTAEQLAGFAAIVNGTSIYNLTDTFKNKTVKLGSSIDLNNLNWAPIGDPMSDGYVGFEGTFDGQGYTISNLNIDNKTSWGQGLFGYLQSKDVVIKNLTVNNAIVNAEDTSGSIAGYAWYGTLENVHLTGNVAISGIQQMGGLVGNGYYVNFKNCSLVANEGSFITATTNSFVGGIVGYHGGTGLEIKNCTVKNLTLSAYGAIGTISGIEGGNSVIDGCTVENVVLNKTNEDSLPSVGLACGSWSTNSTQPVTIKNNSFKNITLNGTYSEVKEYEFDLYFGTGYEGGLINSSVILENNTEVNTQNNLVKKVKTVVVATVEELTHAFNTISKGDVIDATGVEYTINNADHFVVPGGVTIKGLKVEANYRGGNYVIFGGNNDDLVEFVECSFGNSNRSIVLGGSADGALNVVYNNCTFSGQVITNYVDNTNGVATFNNCTFTNTSSPSYSFTEAMGGTHIFNNCTFNYTGLSQSSMGVLNNASINVYSESEYFTVAIFTGCTFTNCGRRTYGPNSTLTIK